MPRPKRKEALDRLNLQIAVKSKRKAFRLASSQRLSIGRLFENLLDAEEARQRTDGTAARA